MDRYAARTARQHMLERLDEPIDHEALCFGRIDPKDGSTLYLGRAAVHGEGSKLLVVNWRMPAASPFYTASRNDPQGLVSRRRFKLDQLRLLGIVEDRFVDTPRETATEPEHRVSDAVPAAPEIVEQATGPIPPTEEAEDHVTDAILAEMDRARGAEMR